ncbi:MAG: Nramp family divalent metal transporter [Pirellulaceae bacterium]
MSQAKPSSAAAPDKSKATTVETPPTSILGILSRLGPGLIIAGSIVGSGELIATTKTGAEAGFWLLWLIIVGCIIKVFVQVELGRDAIVRGQTTMSALSEVPGPSIKGHGNWLLWYYFVMFAFSIGQLGGIVGGVGQAMAISMPLTQQGRDFNEYLRFKTDKAVAEKELQQAEKNPAAASDLPAKRARLERDLERLAKFSPDFEAKSKYFWSDDRIWALLIAIATSILLVVGRYGMIEGVTTALVAMFTLATVLNVIMLQTTKDWGISFTDIMNGLSFRLPPPSEPGYKTALMTALKTFGIIGVGANELLAYPYFCVEKGYARFTGHRDESESWGQRARGWMNVMRWDAWCSMVVYTVATIAFYLLGAAVLGRSGLIPEDSDLMRTLNVMYEPVFGQWAEILFLVGAFAVLYSTYFVANAGHSRVLTDALQAVGLLSRTDKTRRLTTTLICGILPFVCLGVYYLAYFANTSISQLVLVSGMMQALMLPMISGAALYFRYKLSDRRVTPGKVWDVFLWISTLGMFLAAGVLMYIEVNKALNQ